MAFVVGCGVPASTSERAQSLDVVAQNLGFADFSIDSFERTSLEQRRLHEDTVTTCMLERGFEYTPEYDKRRLNQPRIDSGETSASYAETHGWGYAESLLRGDPSPNAQFRRSLSEAELEAYNIALWSTEGATTPCADLAAQKVADESKLAVAFDEYGDELDALVEQFWIDLRIISFHDEWSVCMAERGYEYRTPTQMQTDLEVRSRSLVSASMTELDAVLGELLEYETNAATASLECGMPPSAASQPEIYRIVLADLAHSFLQGNPDFAQS